MDVREDLSWKKQFLETALFTQAKAYQPLLEKARSPLDLTKLMTRERMEKYRAESGSFSLLYGFEKVDEETLSLLTKLAEERQVFQQMKAMVDGKPINWIEGHDSEKRAVLHTEMRKHTADSPAELEVEKLRKLSQDLFPHFDTMLFVGIGGSELGPHAICDALKQYWKEGKSVFYAGNVDPDELTHILHSIDPKKTLVVIVSKSGTTLETATNEARIREFFSTRVSSVRDHFLAVTCPRTPMDDPNAYRASLYLFDYVGGRYSATSMVGGAVIAFMAGCELFEEFLDGAATIDGMVLERSLEKNIPLLMALLGIWNRNFLGYPTVAIIPYSSSLHRFPAHLQQCDMESNGKSITRSGEKVTFSTGPVIWGEPGTNAQHSFFQLLHQGTDVVPVEFIGFRSSQCGEDFSFRGTTSQEKLVVNMLAQGVALGCGMRSQNPNKNFSGNRPSLFLLAEKLTPHTVGELLAIYEHKIAFQGFLWGINSFDQEGVQLGKVLSDKFLKNLSRDPLLDVASSLSGVEQFLVDLIGKKW